MKICIDAGHFGLYNRSPVNKAYYESIMTWKLHLYLKEELEELGHTVITTRKEQGKDLEVYERGKIAKGCDLFLSLHSNACDSESVDRVSVFHSFDNRNDSATLGKKLATCVKECMGVSEGRLCQRVGITGKNEYYGVLRGARNVNCPLYYIVEHSFHTNKKATQWLLNDDNLRKMAHEEAICIHSYFNPIQKGDVNKDGQVDAFDYMMVKSAVLGNLKLTEEQKELADMNNDGQVDAFDYMILKSEVLNNGKK